VSAAAQPPDAREADGPRPAPATTDGRALAALPDRKQALVAQLLVSTAVVLLLLATRVYPGGSWADPQAQGFEWLVNFWCDLMRTQGLNGLPNGTASALARAGFVALAAGLLLYWPLAAEGLGSARLARCARVAGRLAGVGLLAVALLPYDTLQLSHSVATLAAGACGALAVCCLVLGRAWPLRLRWSLVWGAGLLLAMLANIVLYVGLVVRRDGTPPAMPGVQVLATLLLVLWVASTLAELRRGPGS